VKKQKMNGKDLNDLIDKMGILVTNQNEGAIELG
jgi:hypothetical protein